MKFLLKSLITLVVGVILGLGLTWLTVVRGAPGAIADGPWHTSLTIGSVQSGPWQRASVALHGLFALGRGETLYYTATHDSGGQRLDGHCIYRIKGHEPDARWWSITAYGSDDFLMKNKENRYSISKTAIAHKPDGSFIATASRHYAPGNWIPVTAPRFSLTLRLYNPAPGVVADPANALVPQIIRVVCP